ncbi:MAG: hypothetical protein ACM37W_02910 [Actinomycetota bacterium]
MPGGHASHKSTSAKPNTNANGIIDTGLGSMEDPTGDLSEILKPVREGEEITDNSLATQRPDQNLQSEDEPE